MLIFFSDSYNQVCSQINFVISKMCCSNFWTNHSTHCLWDILEILWTNNGPIVWCVEIRTHKSTHISKSKIEKVIIYKHFGPKSIYPKSLFICKWIFNSFFFSHFVRALASENSNSTLFYHSKKPLYHCQWRFCDKGRKCENGPNLSLSSLEVFIMKNQVQNSKCIMNKRLMVLWQKRITMLVTKM